ncbi:MAG: hypothetical protein JO057_31070 [Chloroflexi bacterium]|nr:hypothetical protein [Chloroflexota bacterium]
MISVWFRALRGNRFVLGGAWCRGQRHFHGVVDRQLSPRLPQRFKATCAQRTRQCLQILLQRGSVGAYGALCQLIVAVS